MSALEILYLFIQLKDNAKVTENNYQAFKVMWF